MESREAIAEALEAGDIAVAIGGQLTAPCVLLEPGDPWADAHYLAGRGRRLGRWQLTAIAGRADTGAAYEELASLIDRIDTALLAVKGLELPIWARPSDRTLGNVPYAATTATVQLLTGEAP